MRNGNTYRRTVQRTPGGENAWATLKARWEDSGLCEEGGASISSLQKRNIEALKDILCSYQNQHVVIGTHGMALGSILKTYNPSFGYDDYMRIRLCMPYVIRPDFDGERFTGQEELLKIESFYPHETESYKRTANANNGGKNGNLL